MGNQHQSSQHSPIFSQLSLDQNSLDKQIYLWRSNSQFNKYLPQVTIKRQFSNNSNHFMGLGSCYKDIQAFLEFELYACDFTRLKKTLSIQGFIYAFKSLLHGHRQIFCRSGFTLVHQRCCFVTPDGQIRTWVNPNYFLNQPWTTPAKTIELKDSETYKIQFQRPTFLEAQFQELAARKKLNNIPKILNFIFNLSKELINIEHQAFPRQLWLFLDNTLNAGNSTERQTFNSCKLKSYSFQKILQLINDFTSKHKINQKHDISEELKLVFQLKKSKKYTISANKSTQRDKTSLHSHNGIDSSADYVTYSKPCQNMRLITGPTSHRENTSVEQKENQLRTIQTSQVTDLPWDKQDNVDKQQQQKNRKISKSLYQPKVNDFEQIQNSSKQYSKDQQKFDRSARGKINSLFIRSHQYSMNLYCEAGPRKKSLKEIANKQKKEKKGCFLNRRRISQQTMRNQYEGEKTRKKTTLLAQGISTGNVSEEQRDSNLPIILRQKSKAAQFSSFENKESLEILKQFETYMSGCQEDRIKQANLEGLSESSNQKEQEHNKKRSSETSLQMNMMTNSLNYKKKLKKSYFRLQKEGIQKSSNRISLPSNGLAIHHPNTQHERAFTARTITRLLSSEEENFKTSIGQISSKNSYLQAEPYSGILSKMGRNANVKNTGEKQNLLKVEKMPNFCKRKSYNSGSDSNYSIQL